MTRRASRVDANQAEVVRALRAVGATVQHLHMVGAGCPDLLVGYGGVNYLFEVKDGTKAACATRLTQAEAEWFNQWRGMANVVKSAEEAIAFVRGEHQG